MPFNPPIPNRKGDGKSPGLFSALVQAEKLIQIAFILPCAAFIGWLGGDWLGNRVHQPWLAALGVAFGGAAGLVYVIKLAMHAANDPANADEASNDDTSGKGNDSKRS